jgi:serine-type D-Ala-D-Ala carboxypeptidase
MPAPSSLLSAFSEQDKVFSAAFSLLKDAIAARAFPAASIAVTRGGKLIALKAFGHFIYEKDSGAPFKPVSGLSGDFDSAVTPSTLFDLASLTKVIATTTMAMILYERGLLELDAPIIGTLPEFLADSCDEIDPRRHDVTFRMLLAHSSGLPAYEKLFLKAHSRDELLFAALTTALSADPGVRAEYSDIGFITLGAALERIANEESLAQFCQREIFGPLAMSNTTFNPPADLRPQIPPTADERKQQHGPGTCALETTDSDAISSAGPKDVSPTDAHSSFRDHVIQGRIVQGFVQDENARVLGGIAPHAGLFSTAEDLARFAHCMLNGGAPILRPATIALFTRRQSTPPGTSRALGWDTPSSPASPSQSGKYFGPASFGHLGYTGTSLWIDPERQLSITLLSNRTWPDCANQAIRQIRPQFYDAIVKALP